MSGGHQASPLLPSSGGFGRPQFYHTASVAWRTFLPWTFFVLVSLAFTFVYQIAPPFVWLVVTLCVGMSALLMFLPFPWQHAPENKTWYLLLGLLCLGATLLATLAGFWNFQRHMAVFWTYEGSRAYTNVLPTESALAHLDGGKISFSSEARVDVGKALGFKDGSWYCVAPIVTDAAQTKIEYWAVGVDCCGRKGTFTCDDVGDASAHSGLVVTLNASPFASWHEEQYGKAVKEATSKGGLTSSEDVLFVRWVTDADAAQAAYWNSAVGFLAGSCGLHLLISTVVGFALHFGSRPGPRGKLPGQRFSA